MTNNADLIDGLGGATKMSARFAETFDIVVSAKAIHMWKVNGVPWKHRHAVAQFAQDDAVALPPGFLGPAPALAGAAS